LVYQWGRREEVLLSRGNFSFTCRTQAHVPCINRGRGRRTKLNTYLLTFTSPIIRFKKGKNIENKKTKTIPRPTYMARTHLIPFTVALGRQIRRAPSVHFPSLSLSLSLPEKDPLFSSERGTGGGGKKRKGERDYLHRREDSVRPRKTRRDHPARRRALRSYNNRTTPLSHVAWGRRKGRYRTYSIVS